MPTVPHGGSHRVSTGEIIMHGVFLTGNGGLASIITMVAVATGFAGCASTSDITRLQQDVAAVRQEAQDAKQAAARASQQANDAKQQANDAKQKAEQAIANSADAQSKAASAQKAAADSNERVDRMFKKSMNK
jgi:murein lipoprotein